MATASKGRIECLVVAVPGVDWEAESIQKGVEARWNL